MTLSTDPEAGQAFTRTSVERYLSAAAAAQSRLESAIADARRRAETALQEEERLLSLQEGADGAAARRDGGPAAARPTVFPLAVDDDGHAWREQDLPTAAVTDIAR